MKLPLCSSSRYLLLLIGYLDLWALNGFQWGVPHPTCSNGVFFFFFPFYVTSALPSPGKTVLWRAAVLSQIPCTSSPSLGSHKSTATALLYAQARAATPSPRCRCFAGGGDAGGCHQRARIQRCRGSQGMHSPSPVVAGMTQSPGFRAATRCPTSSTSPTPSFPATAGSGESVA